MHLTVYQLITGSLKGAIGLYDTNNAVRRISTNLGISKIEPG